MIEVFDSLLGNMDNECCSEKDRPVIEISLKRSDPRAKRVLDLMAAYATRIQEKTRSGLLLERKNVRILQAGDHDTVLSELREMFPEVDWASVLASFRDYTERAAQKPSNLVKEVAQANPALVGDIAKECLNFIGGGK